MEILEPICKLLKFIVCGLDLVVFKSHHFLFSVQAQIIAEETSCSWLHQLNRPVF